MQFSKNITLFSLLATVYTLAAAIPVEERNIEANQATVNAYSGSACDGTSQTFTVTGSGSYKCVAVTNVESIEVSENNCATYTWSGSNCAGSSKHITGNACFSVLFASVSVQC